MSLTGEERPTHNEVELAEVEVLPAPEACPFCDGEVCTDESACAEAAQAYWDDQQLMYLLGK